MNPVNENMVDNPKNFHFTEDAAKAYVPSAEEQSYETKHPLLRKVAIWVGIGLVAAICLTVLADAIWGIL